MRFQNRKKKALYACGQMLFNTRATFCVVFFILPKGEVSPLFKSDSYLSSQVSALILEDAVNQEM